MTLGALLQASRGTSPATRFRLRSLACVSEYQHTSTPPQRASRGRSGAAVDVMFRRCWIQTAQPPHLLMSYFVFVVKCCWV